MRLQRRVLLPVLALLALAGCASTEVTSRQVYEGDRLPKPGRIIVHDFAATPQDVPADSPLAGAAAGEAPALDAEQLATARALGAAVAEALTARLQGIDLPAVRAAGQAPPEVNDIVLHGYFLSIDEGSATERVAIGFGAGAAELQTAVEGYQMTAQGLQRLGGGQLQAGGGKVPGALLPLAIVAAKGNPLGLLVNTAVQAEGEVSGRATIEGAAERTADEIFEQMRPTIERQGWT